MNKKGYWTKERCKEVALKYNSRKDFKLGEQGAYLFCKRNNYLDELSVLFELDNSEFLDCEFLDCEFLDWFSSSEISIFVFH